MITITKQEYDMVVNVAEDVGAKPADLVDLISFESGFDPKIKNPLPESSARGLIQIIDVNARRMGYRDSLDLVNQNPTIIEQLDKPVREYLTWYQPYPTRQSLFMGVYYPKAQYWPLDKRLSDEAISWNPGIETPADYMQLVEDLKEPVRVQGGMVVSEKRSYMPVFLWTAAAAGGLFLLTRKN